MMIKLIASDVDNTLVPYATPVIPDKISSMISELRGRGIFFAVASGRQYKGLLKTFAAVANDVIFIAENGAHIQMFGEPAQFEIIDRDIVREMVEEYRLLRPEYEFVVATKQCEMLEKPSAHLLDIMEKQMNYEVKIVDDVLAIDAEVLKISLYARKGVRKIAKSRLIPKWRSRVNIMIGGDEWMPSISRATDKGLAIRKLQKKYGFSPEETMVFGDGGNDIGMFREASETFAVDNADEELKTIAKHRCPSSDKMGVYETIMNYVLRN
jgi:Cof subfamily protein (haloacid dehalogenase superfamily)